MASASPLAAYSPKAKGDDEVLSQRTFPIEGRSRRPSRRHQRAIHRPPDTWGSKPPWRLAMGAELNSAPI